VSLFPSTTIKADLLARRVAGIPSRAVADDVITSSLYLEISVRERTGTFLMLPKTKDTTAPETARRRPCRPEYQQRRAAEAEGPIARRTKPGYKSKYPSIVRSR